MELLLRALIAWIAVLAGATSVSPAAPAAPSAIVQAAAPRMAAKAAPAATASVRTSTAAPAATAPACIQPPWETAAPTPYPGQGVTLTMAPNPVIVGVCPYLVVSFNGSQFADGTAIPGFDRNNLVSDGTSTDSRGVTLFFWHLTRY